MQAIRATVVMRTMLEAQGIAYVHVLQPNQYYTSRRFTPEESAVAINAASPFKSGVERGYPALLAEAAAQALEARTGFFDRDAHLRRRGSARVCGRLLPLHSRRLPAFGRLHRPGGHDGGRALAQRAVPVIGVPACSNDHGAPLNPVGLLWAFIFRSRAT